MQKLRTNFLKSYNVLLSGLMALLGFATGCDSVFNPPEPVVEYGTPSAKFIVNGQVTDSASNQAIPNIQVIMYGDTVETDEKGQYSVVDSYSFPSDQTFTVEFRDIDGATNGEYAPLDSIVEFKDPQFTNGDGHWYQGETSKQLDIKLKPKE